MAGEVMTEDPGRLAHLLRWCGMALMAAGVLMVVATLLHPSPETATTIVASESRLVAAHVTQLSGCWCCWAFPAFMRPKAAGWAGSDWRASCLFHWHLPDRGHRELWFPRPGLGQAVACSAGLH
jgi:hypothetical protein